MPLPLLATLSARARQLWPIIQRGVREGLSANAIERVLRLDPPGIRRTDLLAIVRAERGIEQAGARLRTLRRDFMPDPRRLPEALTKLRRALSFEVKISGFDIENGEDVTRFVTVSFDDPLTRAEIENVGLGFIEEDMQRYGFAVTDVLLVRGMKAGVEGTLLPPRAA